MNPIRFKIEFITPLLIGGAGKDSCDPLSLGKALRGSWRFWFRAACGGVLQGNDNLRVKTLHQLEEKVFGSTGQATFKLLAIPLSATQNKFPRCPHKDNKAFREGLVEGTQFEIRILPRNGFDRSKAIEALKAVIWLWANLGSLGNRSRRGFGSPFLLDDNGVFPGGLPILKETGFKNREDLVEHLKTGIANACTLIYALFSTLDNSNQELTIDAIPLSQDVDFFVLRDLRQVMVGENALGKNLFAQDILDKNKKVTDRSGVIFKIHGESGNDEIGRSNPRYASPVYVRLHKIADGYIPVATWSRQLGISTGGNAPNTALDYIKSSLGCSQDILGNAL